MKKIFLSYIFSIVFCAMLFSQKKNDIVATVGTYQITADEFERVYNRSNLNIIEENNRKTPEEYLDLYLDFKRKVLDAQARGFDTTQAFIDEFTGHRNDLAKQYLSDAAFNEELVKEAYERMKKEIDASHILISFPENRLPADTLQAYNKALEIRKEIEAGLDFSEAAAKYSHDPSAAKNRGHLGWFTVFQMIAPFEDVAYNTPAGEVSQPVRTQFGYHLIKVHDVRYDAGEIKVAHIVKFFPRNATPAQKETARAKIDSLYNLLQNGADFADLARENSDDEDTAGKSGEMQWFGQTNMIPQFANPAFELKNDGDYTAPVETTLGYHIIKRLETRKLADYEKVKPALQNKVMRDRERIARSRKFFLDNLKTEYGFEQNREAVNRKIEEVAGQVKNITIAAAANDAQNVLFVFNGKNYTAQQWIDEFNEMPFIVKGDTLRAVAEYYNDWEEGIILEEENRRLEEKYPEFRSIVLEYHDGLLLFAVSEEKIWQRAATDTLGLQNFYETNKSKYMWDERFEGAIVSCTDAGKKKEMEAFLKKNKSLDAMYEAMEIDGATTDITDGIWQKGENKIIDFFVWNSEKPNDLDTEITFAEGEILAPQPKSLDEAKGFHISDYQKSLEEEWINELRIKYKAKINQKTLKSISGV